MPRTKTIIETQTEKCQFSQNSGPTATSAAERRLNKYLGSVTTETRKTVLHKQEERIYHRLLKEKKIRNVSHFCINFVLLCTYEWICLSTHTKLICQSPGRLTLPLPRLKNTFYVTVQVKNFPYGKIYIQWLVKLQQRFVVQSLVFL